MMVEMRVVRAERASHVINRSEVATKSNRPLACNATFTEKAATAE
jgi:hypothetical protein